MTEEQIFLVVIGVGTLAVNLIGAIICGTWVLGKSNEKLLEKIDEKIKNERKEIDVHLTNISTDIETTRKWFGEAMAAIREKITQTELWNRDNFVSKNTFQAVIKDLKDFFVRFEDKLDLRFNKLEDKIDAGPKQ